MNLCGSCCRWICHHDFCRVTAAGHVLRQQQILANFKKIALSCCSLPFKYSASRDKHCITNRANTDTVARYNHRLVSVTDRSPASPPKTYKRPAYSTAAPAARARRRSAFHFRGAHLNSRIQNSGVQVCAPPDYCFPSSMHRSRISNHGDARGSAGLPDLARLVRIHGLQRRRPGTCRNSTRVLLHPLDVYRYARARSKARTSSSKYGFRTWTWFRRSTLLVSSRVDG